MKKNIILFFVLIGTLSIKAQCDYTVELWDSWGNGWDAGSLDVIINGAVDSTLTIDAVQGNFNSYTFTVNDGDLITFNFVQDLGFFLEQAWRLIDPNGIVAVEEGAVFGLGPNANGFGPEATSGPAGGVTALCPTCFVAQNLSVSNISSNSAQINWTHPDMFVDYIWELQYSDTAVGTPGAIASGVGLAGNSVNTGAILMDNTLYDFFIRTNCGAGDTSVWQGPITFRTLCSAFTTPWSESFEPNSTTEICWTVINNNGDNNSWDLNSGAFPGNGVQNVTFDANFGTQNDDYLISPSTTLTGGERLRFSYSVLNMSFPNSFQLLLSTTGIAPADFTDTILDLATYTNLTYLEQIVDLSAYTGDVFIAWHIPNTAASSWQLYLDDIFIEPIPTCLATTNEISNSITSTSANLIWNSVGVGSSFLVEYDTVGFDIGTGVTLTLSDTMAVVTGLMQNTEYQWYIREVCSVGDTSLRRGPFSFRTACGLISAPWSETFEPNSNTLPCWTVLNENGDDRFWEPNLAFGPNNGLQSAGILTDNSGDNDDYLISPNLVLTGGERLRYFYNTFGFGNPSDYQVLLSTTGQNPSDFTDTILPLTRVDNVQYMEQIIDLDAYTGNVYIAWHVPIGGIGSLLYIDDINFEAIPNCVAPLNLSVSNVTFTTADLNWTPGGGATDAQVEYGMEGFALGTGTSVIVSNAATYSVSGLSPNVSYDWYVRDICGLGDTSVWTGPFNFFSGYCAPSSIFPQIFIDGFSTTGGISNIENLNSGASANGYDFFADTEIITIPADNSFDFELIISGGASGAVIWVDWNSDLVLDSTEIQFQTSATTVGAGPYTGSILVPAGTPLGDYRMRVLISLVDEAPSNPCDNGTALEAEDYTITVSDCPFPTNINLEFCSGETYTLDNGLEVSTSGLYIDSLVTANGCDSVINYQVNFVDDIMTEVDYELCGTVEEFTLVDGTIVNQPGTYTATGSTVLGCDSLVTYNVSPCVGIFNIENNIEFTIYPNPAKNILNIEFGENINPNNTLKIINVLGQIVFEQENIAIDGTSINTSKFNAGIYFIHLNSENKTSIASFTVAK